MIRWYNMAMTDLLTAHAANQPDKAAVIDDRRGADVRVCTYAELEARSNQLARVILEHGVAPGGKVVWCGQNSMGIVEMINAARKVGATAVPLNYRLSDDEAAYVVDHCDATVVYVDAEYAPLFDRIRDQLPQVTTYLVFDGSASSAPLPDAMIASDPLVAAASADEFAQSTDGEATGATMIYTSGTTGKPKGAYRRTSGSPEQSAAMLGFIGYTPDDIYDHRSAVPLGTGRVHGYCVGHGSNHRVAAQVRGAGLAASDRQVQGDQHVLGPDPYPHDLQCGR